MRARSAGAVDIDDDARLRTIIEEANRSNTSFYPVDPRGLVVFDEGIVPSAQVGPPSANPTLAPRGGDVAPQSEGRRTSPACRRHRWHGRRRHEQDPRRRFAASSTISTRTTCSGTTRPESWTGNSTRSRAREAAGRFCAREARVPGAAGSRRREGDSPDSRGSGAFGRGGHCRRRVFGRLEDRQLGARSRCCAFR